MKTKLLKAIPVFAGICVFQFITVLPLAAQGSDPANKYIKSKIYQNITPAVTLNPNIKAQSWKQHVITRPKFDLKKLYVIGNADLYVAGVPDLTQLGDRRPLQQRLWVRIGNQGTETARNFVVRTYFWNIKPDGYGKSKGVITQVENRFLSELRPGQTITLYPFSGGLNNSMPIAYAVKVDADYVVNERRENNNTTGRLWTTYPDAFLRQIPFAPAP